MSEAARDRLTLGSVEAHCQFLGPAADGYAVERRLDRVAREALPDALAAEAAQAIGAEGGVIRIDRIELDLVLSREMFESSALPRLWAGRIGAALAAALVRGERAGVVWFASHAEFAAAYLEHRFGVARHPDFAFADFAALAHVTPAEAAAELLAARPDYLAALARSGAGRTDPAWLARRLGAEASARILDSVAPKPVAADAGTISLIRLLVERAPPGWRALPAAAAALALVFGFLAEVEEETTPLAAIVPLARAVAAVAHLVSAAPELIELLEAGDDAATVELLPLSAAERREAEFARRLFAGSRGARAAAAVHAALQTPLAVRPRVSKQGRREAKDRGAAPKPRLDSPFAGFALLLPVLRNLALDTLLSPAQAHALILAVLDAPDRLASHAEALADLLLPLPVEPDFAPWPPAIAEDPASVNAEAWTARLLDGFADRLPGLRGSTAPYLRRQFLHVDGTLELEPERLTARLVRPPLAIVLTIAGMTGEQGPLPWRRERGLRILMP